MKIYLNFIMKNEEKVLPRMLNSLLPIIDGIVCVDTGSTDSSKDIVQKFCTENNLECDIFDHPFINFSNARNFALEKVRSKSGFAFWQDCDEEMIYDPAFSKEGLIKQLSIADSGLVVVKYGGAQYARRLFFRTDKKCHWHGAVHEYLAWDEHMREVGISGMHMQVYSDGNSWTEGDIKQKYLKHADILLAEVNKTNDPRDVFYLAQSYKDAGEHEKAIEWYRKRADMTTGYYEERFYAQWYIGKISQDMDKPSSDIVFEYLKSHELDILRGEGILNIICELQYRGMYNSSYIFSKYAMETYHGKNPYPSRQLFIHEQTYSKGIFDAHDLSCRTLGKTNTFTQDPKKGVDVTDERLAITFAYIAYDKSVCEKYLYPSYNAMMAFNNNRHKINSVSIPSSAGNPAKNYNRMISMSNTDYIIFLHADVTFGPDLCERIAKTIKEVPDFGALGIVGVDKDRIYKWSTHKEIYEVETLDCCCILINKKHRLLFDEAIFDDFHLYVEDYCCQLKNFGLKCYTILIDASEISPMFTYNKLIDTYCFFNHHSYTLNQRGSCWGRYHEYKAKLNTKWGREVKTT